MSSENTELFTNHNEKDEDEEKDEARSTKSPEGANRFSTQHFSSWMMLVGLLGREDNYDFDEKILITITMMMMLVRLLGTAEHRGGNRPSARLLGKADYCPDHDDQQFSFEASCDAIIV